MLALVFGFILASGPQPALSKHNDAAERLDSSQARGGSSGRDDGSSREKDVLDGSDGRSGSDEVSSQQDSSHLSPSLDRQNGNGRVIVNGDDRF